MERQEERKPECGCYSRKIGHFLAFKGHAAKGLHHGTNTPFLPGFKR